MTPEALAADLENTALHREFELAIVAADGDRLEMRMPMSPLAERQPGTGQFHGGSIAMLIDVAGAYVVMASLGHGVPTINMRVDFMRPATGTALTAIATTRRVGRTVAVVDVDVIDDNGRVVAIGRGCYSSKAG